MTVYQILVGTEEHVRYKKEGRGRGDVHDYSTTDVYVMTYHHAGLGSQFHM
jgi:hypothetical protein